MSNSQKGFFLIGIILAFFLIAAAIIGVSFYIQRTGSLSKILNNKTIQAENNEPSEKTSVLTGANNVSALYTLDPYVDENVSSQKKTFYLLDPNTGSKREILIELEWFTELKVPKDNKYIFRINRRSIDMASASALDQFKNVVTLLKDEYIDYQNNVLSNDGQYIAYVKYKMVDEKIVKWYISVANTLTKESVDIISFDAPLSGVRIVRLWGINPQQDEIYYIDPTDKPFKLKILNLKDANIKSEKKNLTPDDDFKVDFNNDYSKAYFIEKGGVFEYLLAQDTKKELYRAHNLLLAPNGEYLISAEFANLPTGTGEEELFKFDLKTQRKEVIDDVCLKNAGPEGISNNGKYLWYSAQCITDQEYFKRTSYIIDLASQTDRAKVFSEYKALFVGWLQQNNL